MSSDQFQHHLRRVAISSRGADIDATLLPLRLDPKHTAILLDIDGTLAPVILHPERTRIPAPTMSLLRRLHVEYRLLGIITGRRALDARHIVGLDIDYTGNHGLERLTPHAAKTVLDASVGAWRDRVRTVFEQHCGPDLAARGVGIEDKEFVLTLRWRGASDLAAAQAAVFAVGEVAKKAGLVVQPGRGSIEIRPPVDVDKGTALRRVVDDNPQIRHVLYAGDELGDVSALRALDALRRSGRLQSVVRVGVASDQVPDAILRNADLVVRGPRGVQRLLKRLHKPVKAVPPRTL